MNDPAATVHPTSRSTSTISTTSATAPTSCCCCAPTRPPAAADTPGCPAKYSGYGGILVIVDDPATITALSTGGPAATTYLNTALVNKLSNQIH
jgi:hypothetical protein